MAMSFHSSAPEIVRALKENLRRIDKRFVDGYVDEAIGDMRVLLDECTTRLGTDNDVTLAVTNNLAMKLAENGHDGATALLTNVLEHAVLKWGDADKRVVVLRSNLAAATGMAGSYSSAVRQIESLLENRDQLDPEMVETLQTNLRSWKAKERACHPS
jgi:hypothetical protein